MFNAWIVRTHTKNVSVTHVFRGEHGVSAGRIGEKAHESNDALQFELALNLPWVQVEFDLRLKEEMAVQDRATTSTERRRSAIPGAGNACAAWKGRDDSTPSRRYLSVNEDERSASSACCQ